MTLIHIPNQSLILYWLSCRNTEAESHFSERVKPSRVVSHSKQTLRADTQHHPATAANGQAGQ